jgi:hypothetical protein
MNSGFPEASPALPRATPHRFDLAQWPWSTTLLRGIAAALALYWLMSRWRSGSADAGNLAWTVLLVLVALRWLAGLPDGARRAHVARSKGRWWPSRLVLLLVPSEWIGVLRLLVVTAGGCLAWMFRRRPAPRPVGRRLEDRRKGFYDTLFAMNVISLMTEVPVLLLILSSVAGRPAVHLAAHALEVLAIVGILGDRWLVRAGGHVLTSTHLDLRAGARASACIPLQAIAAIEVLGKKTRPAAWCREHDVHRADTGTVSVLDAPNIVITLHPGAQLTWSRFQAEHAMPRHLFLYLDDPSSLAPAVAEAKARGA